MSQLIDRRLLSSKKSMVNRQRFIQRYRQQIKKSVMDAIAKRSIKDVGQGESVSIPPQDLSEPQFGWGEGGVIERVLPGNREFTPGDKIPRSAADSASAPGSGAASEGLGEDGFTFHLSREEFLDLYFDGLELPDLVRKELGGLKADKTVRAGIMSSGAPVNIHIVRSMRQAAGRRVALAARHRNKIKQIQQRLDELMRQEGSVHEIEALTAQLEKSQHRLQTIPFIDTSDLRYHYRVKQLLPTTQAVMFCLMDVSGSMDEVKKDIAKQFYILLYLFLTQRYENIELVFIRHHTSARVVDEQTFFYSRETGGTVVSSALELLIRMIETRYSPEAWNIYVAQASDGDNWNADSPYCQTLLEQTIMSYVQYFAYVEILPRHHQSLWEAYEQVRQNHANFAMQPIEAIEDIYPVFRTLFERKPA